MGVEGGRGVGGEGRGGRGLGGGGWGGWGGRGGRTEGKWEANKNKVGRWVRVIWGLI